MTEWIEFDVRDFYKQPVTEYVWEWQPKDGMLPRYVETVVTPTQRPPDPLPAGVPHRPKCTCDARHLYAQHERSKGRTLKDIGIDLGVGLERTRQMVAKAERCRKAAIYVAARYIPDDRDARYMVSVLKGIESAAKEASTA